MKTNTMKWQEKREEEKRGKGEKACGFLFSSAPLPLFRLWLALAAVLMIAGGCEDDDVDDKGDPLPKLAEYKVTLGEVNELGGYTEIIRLIPQRPSAQLRLRVTCVGDKLPPGCDTHNPNWRVYAFDALRNVSVSIANPASPDTTATLFFNDFASLPDPPDESLGELGGHYMSFTPSRVPDKMKLAGKQTVYVKVARKIFDPNETEERIRNPPETPVTPSLVISPPAITIQSPATAGSVRVIYKGLVTDLASAVVSEGNADKFSVSVGPRPPLDKTVSFIVNVTYTGPVTGGFYYHTTTLIVTTANGAVGRAMIIARN